MNNDAVELRNCPHPGETVTMEGCIGELYEYFSNESVDCMEVAKIGQLKQALKLFLQMQILISVLLGSSLVRYCFNTLYTSSS